MNDIIKISSWIKPYIPTITNSNISKFCANQDVECLCAYLIDLNNKKQIKIYSKQCKTRSEQEITNISLVGDVNDEFKNKINYCKQCKYSRNPNVVSVEKHSSGIFSFLVVSFENNYFLDHSDALYKIQEFNKSLEKSLQYYKMEYLDSKINKIENLFNSGPKIGISEKNATFFCYVFEIIYCEADKNYTSLYFKNGSKKLITKSLSKIEKILLQYDCFMKIHKSKIVNMNFISKMQNNNIYMENGSIHEIALRRKTEIKKKLKIL